jgi:hypothetical protein
MPYESDTESPTLAFPRLDRLWTVICADNLAFDLESDFFLATQGFYSSGSTADRYRPAPP